MKKIILLMLLTFYSTTFVYADEFDDKIEAYKNIYAQLCDVYCSDTPDHYLEAQLSQQSKILYNEIENICKNAQKVYLNDLNNRNIQYITKGQIWENLRNKLNELNGWKIEKRQKALHTYNVKFTALTSIQEEIKINDMILDKDILVKTALSPAFYTEIKKNLIGFQDPYMYSYVMPKNLMKLFFAASTILLCKNKQPFPLMHSPHSAIQYEGLGRYDVYLNGNIYFSTPDNNDPRHDANRYFLMPSQTEIDLKCLENDVCTKVLAPAKKPVLHILKKEKIVHQMGNMFAYKIPDSLWNQFDQSNPFALILVEDGIPLTTITNVHGSIIENGGGLYNVFDNQYLYFSTTDTINFNPINNEKTYVLVITEPVDDLPEIKLFN